MAVRFLAAPTLRGLLWGGVLVLGALALPRAQAADAPADADTAEAFKPEIWLNIGGFSRHFNRSRHYNESNLGFGIEWRRSPEWSLIAGVYDNSIGRSSQYAAVNWQPWQLGPVKLGAAIGLLDGYPSFNRGGTFFAAVPMASIEGQRFGVNLGLIPSIGNVDGALLLQFKVKLP